MHLSHPIEVDQPSPVLDVSGAGASIKHNLLLGDLSEQSLYGLGAHPTKQWSQWDLNPRPHFVDQDAHSNEHNLEPDALDHSATLT